MCHSWLKPLISICCNRVLGGTFPLWHKVALSLSSLVPLKGSSVICWTNTVSLRKLLKPQGGQRGTIDYPLKLLFPRCGLKQWKKGIGCEILSCVFFKTPAMMNVGTKYGRRKVKAQKALLTRGSRQSVSVKNSFFSPFCPALIVSSINPFWDCVINWMLLICH